MPACSPQLCKDASSLPCAVVCQHSRCACHKHQLYGHTHLRCRRYVHVCVCACVCVCVCVCVYVCVCDVTTLAHSYAPLHQSVTAITFISETGDQPLLILNSGTLSGGQASIHEVTTGTREWLECSNRGVCGAW